MELTMMRSSTSAWAMLLPMMALGRLLWSRPWFSNDWMMHTLMLRMKVENITTRFSISRANLAFSGTLKKPWSV